MEQSTSTEFAQLVALTSGLLTEERMDTLSVCFDNEISALLPLEIDDEKLEKLEKLLRARLACGVKLNMQGAQIISQLLSDTSKQLFEHLNSSQSSSMTPLTNILRCCLKIMEEEGAKKFAREKVCNCFAVITNSLALSRNDVTPEEELSLKLALNLLDCLLSFVEVSNCDLVPNLYCLVSELLFCGNDSISSFAISNIVPWLIKSEQRKVCEIWDLLISRIEFCESNLTPMCLLMNLFLTNASGSSFMENDDFWMLIQKGIISRDQMLRKQARYMLKRSLDYLCTNKIHINTRNFSWTAESSLDLWQDFFLVVESLEEKQVHIIKPVLPLIDKLFKGLDPAWALLALHQAVHHDNNHIVKWGLHFFFSQEPRSSKLDFFIGHLLPALDNTSLYYESELGNTLEKFMQCTAKSGESVPFFKNLLPSASAVSWGPVPLLYFCKSVGNLPKFSAWDSSDLKVLKKFLNDTLTTQDVFLRATCQSMLLRATLSLVDPTQVTMTSWLDILASFNRKESLVRGLNDWLLVVNFLKSEPSFHYEANNFLSGDEAQHVSAKSAARYLVLMLDAGILHNNTIEALANEFEWRLAGIESRPYSFSASPNQVDSLLELFAQIQNELGKDNEWKGSLLAQLLKPEALLGLWGYVRRRLEGGECQDLELIRTYVDCLKLICHVDQKDMKIFDASQLLACAFTQIDDDKAALPTKYFAALVIELFAGMITSNLCCQNKEVILGKLSSWILDNKINKVLSATWKDSQTQRSRITSGVLTAKWKSFSLLIEFPFSLSHDLVLSQAEEAAECGGPETLPFVMSCLKDSLHKEQNIGRVEKFLKKTLAQCFENRKSELFWSAIKQFVKLAFSHEMMAREDLSEILLFFTEKLFDQSQMIAGLYNLIIKNLSNIKAIDNEVFNKQLALGLVFGPINRKDQKILNDACFSVISKGSDIPANILIESNCHASQKVRAIAIKLLLKNAQRSESFAKSMLDSLIEKDLELSRNKKLRYFADSHIHRVKHRIAQSLLLIDSCCQNEQAAKRLLEWSVNSISNENHQPSVRYFIEWLASLVLVRNPSMKDWFFEQLLEATSRKLNSIPSFVSILFLWIVGYSSRRTDDGVFESLLTSTIELLLPWCMAQNYNIRLYGQVALLRIFAICARLGVADVVNSFGILKQSIESSVEQSSGVKNAIRLQEDFFFSVFDPVGHLSLESICIEFPRLTNVGIDEWLSVDKFLLSEEETQTLPLPLRNPDDLLSTSEVANWILKATGATNETDELEETSYSIVQRKVTPWSAMFPENSARDYRTPPLGGLVVVASLIDKAPNLGGLSRTCEILGASELVMGNTKIVDDPSFQSLSVTAEKWINLSEVKPEDLVEYLSFMKKQGYVLMAAEQTSKSQSLQSVKFAKKSLILLGNEKEGIPAELLPYLDVCVEIPQMGVIRSLNVHVTGALFVWQYFQQHSLKTQD